jgi:exodeoxyribonuclease-3
MRIATWNVNSLRARLEKVSWWLERAQPDVLLMQEVRLPDAAAIAELRAATPFDAGLGRGGGAHRRAYAVVGVDTPRIGDQSREAFPL